MTESEYVTEDEALFFTEKEGRTIEPESVFGTRFAEQEHAPRVSKPFGVSLFKKYEDPAVYGDFSPEEAFDVMEGFYERIVRLNGGYGYGTAVTQEGRVDLSEMDDYDVAEDDEVGVSIRFSGGFETGDFDEALEAVEAEASPVDLDDLINVEINGLDGVDAKVDYRSPFPGSVNDGQRYGRISAFLYFDDLNLEEALQYKHLLEKEGFQTDDRLRVQNRGLA